MGPILVVSSSSLLSSVFAFDSNGFSEGENGDSGDRL